MVRRCPVARHEEAAQLHHGSGEVEQPGARCASEGHGKLVGHHLVVAPGLLIRQQVSRRVRRAVVTRQHLRLELGRPTHLPQGGGQGSEPLAPLSVPAVGVGSGAPAMRAKCGGGGA